MGEICFEMLKALNMVGLSWLTHLFNVTWRSETTPVEWQTGVVGPIPREGHLLYCHLLRQQHESQRLKETKLSDKAGSVLGTALEPLELTVQRILHKLIKIMDNTPFT